MPGIFSKQRRDERKQEQEHRRREQAEAEARQHAEAALAEWQTQVDQAEAMVALAEGFHGADPGEADTRLVPKKGERVYFIAQGAALVEPRRLPGRWEGGHTGLSFRVAKGLYVRTGTSRGTYQQGAEVLQPIDNGEAVITNQRVLFLGDKQTREWAFSKLMGVQYDEERGATYIQVSNRQKVSGVLTGPDWLLPFRFRLSLAVSDYNDTRPGVLTEARAQLAQLRAQKPAPPLPLTPEPQLPPPPPPPALPLSGES